jgi:hypothetical protein
MPLLRVQFLFLILAPFRKVCLDLFRPFPIYFPDLLREVRR